MEALLIFPAQLLKRHPLVKKDRLVIFCEHARYFNPAFHKMKLLFHRISMIHYEKDLKKRGFNTLYLPYQNCLTTSQLFKILIQKGVESVYCLDPHDLQLGRELLKESKRAQLPLIWGESPQFLTSIDEGEAFLEGKTHFSMAQFYVSQRKKLKILTQDGKPVGGKWSFDTENRRKMPLHEEVPALPIFKKDPFLLEVQRSIYQDFPNSLGECQDFFYPADFQQAETWLEDFIDHRLEKFGDYEDAMDPNEPFLFHSLLSPLLNSGLLTPEEVIDKVLKKTALKKIPLNSLEGFIRQVIGWREFVRIVYLFKGDEQQRQNFFNHKRKLPAVFWTAETGIPLSIILSPSY